MTSKTVGYFLGLSIGFLGGAALATTGLAHETALLGLAGVVVFGVIGAFQDLKPPQPPRPPLDRRRGRG
jgi:hypothetical protein